MKIISTAILTLAIWGLGTTLVSVKVGAMSPRTAHVFPDGYIDRAVSVVIRDRTVNIEYSIGMNDATLKQLLDQWKSASAAAGNSFPIDNLPANRQHESDTPEKTAAAGQSSASVDESSEAADDYTNDPELATRFRQMAPAQLLSGLVVTCNGTEIRLEPSRHPPGLRRHMTMTTQYEFTLPPHVKPDELQLVDTNFEEQGGAIRLSLKTMGNAILTQSNVAPILVRATPVELDGLTAEERRHASTITGQIVQVSE